jgi:glycosyltransferase involved in cell wall biosynthesis
MPEPADPELPPISAEPLSVILPAYNAAGVLPEVLGGWRAFLESLQRPYEIILVDDGSIDGTGGLARFLGGRLSKVVVLDHPEPRGLGAALRTGLAAARFPLVGHALCDRQYAPEELGRLLAVIDKVHMVSGYRVSARVPFWLRCLGLAYRGGIRLLTGELPEPLPGWLGWKGHGRRFLARWLFGVRFQDVDCAFRLYRRSIFGRIPVQSDGSFALVEILAKANFLGCIMAEEPVTHQIPPAEEPDPTRSLFRQTWKEARRLLSHPDFGPPVAPEVMDHSGDH